MPKIDIHICFMLTNYSAKFHVNLTKKFGVIKLRHIPWLASKDSNRILCDVTVTSFFIQSRQKIDIFKFFMWTKYHAKFCRNPAEEFEVIKLRRNLPPPPQIDGGMESSRLDRVKE